MIGAGIISIQALVLLAMGQSALCPCGYLELWHGNIKSAENSQHLTDWYTYTHVIHGFGLYFLLWLFAPEWPVGLRLAAAIGLEAGWKILENTPLIIDRYRQLALAQGYVGDSIINSVSDTVAMALGFALARLLPTWTAVPFVVAIELFVGVMVHDNLALNMLQLIQPSEAVSRWQAGG